MPYRKIITHQYEPPRHPGDKGTYVEIDREVWVPEERKPYEKSAWGDAFCWIMGTILFLLVLWGWSEMMGDDPPGRCRGELGYMGQVEQVDCEEAP